MERCERGIDPDADRALLGEALRLASRGRGRVEPNPMVGCVIAREGEVVARGAHTAFGQPHAEPEALADARRRGVEVAGATAYVTLEPCCHRAKKTPPCAPRLIDAKIARVVIGCLDPNPQVNGQGVKMLQEAGIRVDVVEGSVGEKCRTLIAPFTRLTRGLGPTLTLKWAQSVDRKVAGRNGRRTAISGPEANRVVHDLRGRCDAILIGIATALHDDPSLTVRGVEAPRVPQRWVLDSRLRLPIDSALVRTARNVPVHVVTTRDDAPRRSALEAAGVVVHRVEADQFGRVELDAALSLMKSMTHVLVEPGPTLARAVMARSHRVWVIESKRVAVGEGGVDAPEVDRAFLESARVELREDVLREWLNPDAAEFHGVHASVELWGQAGSQQV